jgi:hypothetical protein
MPVRSPAVASVVVRPVGGTVAALGVVHGFCVTHSILFSIATLCDAVTIYRDTEHVKALRDVLGLWRLGDSNP